MQWDDLLVFRALASHLSFSRTAAELYVSRATVSHRIQRLERAMGVRLVERTTRRVSLTKSGHLLLTWIESVDSSLQSLRIRLHEADHDRS